MMSKYIEYMKSFPHEIDQMLKKNPIAYVPFGALEWHGEHNILGVDSLKATYICQKCAEITGGVLFPCVNYGAFDTMKFPYTFSFKKRSYKRMTRSLAKQLCKMGFKILIFLTGHYPKAQIKNVKKASTYILKKINDCYAIGIPEQTLVADKGYFGDHAAEWETSIMMAINSNYVRLDLIPIGLKFPERARKHGILGRDPTIQASKEKGEKILHEIILRLTTAIEKVQKTCSPKPFADIYDSFKRARNKKKGLDGLFEIYGIGSKKEGWEYVKWLNVFSKGKKYDPNYEYPND